MSLTQRISSVFLLSCFHSPTAFVDPHSAAPGSFLGSDIIFLPIIDKNAGKVSIGISRTPPQTGVSGSGVAATQNAHVQQCAAANTRHHSFAKCEGQ
jgi:hypothetical protein